ncbi:hypothetical protein H6758_03575 [Candidatus Nomurabacteria bacterium]|nr:hypothetical protein [Candidatus Nomurabacteria bacterium]
MEISNIYSVLKHFSLSKQEVDIYLAVLSLENPSTSEIAKEVKMTRTAAYFHIKNLQEKGLLFQSPRGKIQHFNAKPPAQLATDLTKLTLDLKLLVPELESLQKVTSERPEFEVVESKKGYFSVYEKISLLPKGSMFRVLEGKKGLIDELDLLTPNQWNIFFDRVVKREIITHGIFTKESLAVPKQKFLQSPEVNRTFEKRIWDLRTLPESIIPINELALIYGDRISFLLPETSMVITLRHSGIVAFMCAMFDGLFHFAEKLEGWS